LHYIEFPDKETENTAFDLMSSDTDWWRASGIHDIIRQFEERYNYSWQIGSNGRSGGYLVLYQGGIKPAKDTYKRYCTSCGQGNWKIETTVCGRCGEATMIDYPFVSTYCKPGLGTDMDDDFEDWDFDSLRDRVGLLWDFNTTINTAIEVFIAYCQVHRVVEEEVMVPKTVRVAEEIG
jgi:hypothetical protein